MVDATISPGRGAIWPSADALHRRTSCRRAPEWPAHAPGRPTSWHLGLELERVAEARMHCGIAERVDCGDTRVGEGEHVQRLHPEHAGRAVPHVAEHCG